MRNGPRKLTATLINLCLLLPTVAVFIAVIAAPIASAEASCDDPSSDIPAINQYFEEHSVEDGWGIWWEGGSEDLRSLDVGFSTEMEIENDSANAISMELVPGYRYTFCITLVADSAYRRRLPDD